MLKLQPFQIYFTALYVLGLNSGISFIEPHKKRSRALTHSLRMFNIFVNLFIVYTTSVQFHYARSFLLLVHLGLVSEMGINFVAVFENWFNFHSSRQILQTISFTIKAIESSSKVEFPYVSIVKSIKIKLTLIILTTLLRVVSHYKYFNPLQNFSWSIFYFLKGAHLLHLIFYIEFVRITITGLSQNVLLLASDSSSQWQRNEAKELLHLMRKIKLIYLKLCRIARIANSLFGWFLVSLMVEMTTKLIYYAYFVFVYSNSCGGCYLCVLRKYLFCIHKL